MRAIRVYDCSSGTSRGLGGLLVQTELRLSRPARRSPAQSGKRSSQTHHGWSYTWVGWSPTSQSSVRHLPSCLRRLLTRGSTLVSDDVELDSKKSSPTVKLKARKYGGLNRAKSRAGVLGEI